MGIQRDKPATQTKALRVAYEELYPVVKVALDGTSRPVFFSPSSGPSEDQAGRIASDISLAVEEHLKKKVGLGLQRSGTRVQPAHTPVVSQ